jgi:hypothetical protein
MGAKNHAILMPDGVYRRGDIRYKRDLHFQANKNLAINSIAGAAFGGRLNATRKKLFLCTFCAAAGQRCMAISVGENVHLTMLGFNPDHTFQRSSSETRQTGYQASLNVLRLCK